MQEHKKKIEAILFTTGRFMSIEEISQLCNLSQEQISKAIESLKKDYSEKDSALHLIEENNKFRLNIKSEYGFLANKLVSSKEFDNPTTKTLAIIAYQQPVLQSKVIKVRGNKAYDHIKLLRESELITAEKAGRTRLLKLTQKFYDYFDIAESILKEKLSQITQNQKVEKPENPQ
ncbi:MAG: SMC-Scp complex subunit ScpB [Nanoarchaeota archaeon]